MDGIDYSEDYWILIVTGLVFGLVNFLVKPIVKLLALPLIVITFGHHPLLHQPASCSTSRAGSCPGFEIDSFMSGIWATVIITVVNWVLTSIFDVDERRRR